MRHEDLDLLLSRAGNGFTARVVHSPAGEGQCAEFGVLFSELELENLQLRIAAGRARTRRVEAGPVADAKRFGAVLFDAIFSGDTRECLRRSQDRARELRANLRIRLRVADCPELAGLPWEFLYDASDDSFLALSVGTPLIRYLQLPDPPRAIAGTLPLRVLVVRSEPANLPELQLEQEWAQVTGAVQGLIQSGAVTFTTLAKASLSELRLALMQGQFHVLHFMGHGSFSDETGGLLYFTGPDGRAVAVTAADVGVLMRDHTSMRMAVLNACEGARIDPGDPFAGVAETLVRRGVPAVVAMQFEFTDRAAVEFAPALYGALAAGFPVDAAVTEARKAVYTVSPVEWATPVLHMRAADATLFQLSQSQAPPAPPPAPPPGTGAISIRRREELFGRGRSVSVLIDGFEAGKLHSGQRVLYEMPSGTHRVQIKLDWNSSPEVLVTIAPGECAAFVCGHSPGGTGRQMLRSVSNPDNYFQLLREQ